MSTKRILLYLQSALCILLVAMLASAAVGIYRNGIAEKRRDPLAQVYTREKAEAALKPIRPVFLASVGVTIACAALKVRGEEENKPARDVELSRDLARSRVVRASAAMRREQAVQKKLLYGGWGGFGLCMLPVLLYMVNGDHFPNGDPERAMGALTVHVLPWIILGFACLIVSAVLQGRSIRREYDACITRIREEKASGLQAEPKAAEKTPNVTILRVVLLVLAAAFILVGIRNGSMTAVVNKAIRICTECVGLG